MKEYKITATLKQDLEITIEADSYEEALRIAEYDLLTEDFDVVGAEFNLDRVKEVNAIRRLTAQEIIEDNKKIYAENNIKNLDDLNAYTLRTRLENKGK